MKWMCRNPRCQYENAIAVVEVCPWCGNDTVPTCEGCGRSLGMLAAPCGTEGCSDRGETGTRTEVGPLDAA